MAMEFTTSKPKCGKLNNFFAIVPVKLHASLEIKLTKELGRPIFVTRIHTIGWTNHAQFIQVI